MVKTKMIWVCKSCYEDTSLDATDQFGYPRGTDIRKDSCSERKDKRYCGTCGVEHSIEKIEVQVNPEPR
jgi:hypothetical protein